MTFYISKLFGVDSVHFSFTLFIATAKRLFQDFTSLQTRYTRPILYFNTQVIDPTRSPTKNEIIEGHVQVCKIVHSQGHFLTLTSRIP